MSASRKTKKDTNYQGMFSFLLEIYLTDDVIAEQKPETTDIAQTSNMKPSQSTEELITENICWEDLNEECTLYDIFIEFLSLLIFHSMRQ